MKALLSGLWGLACYVFAGLALGFLIFCVCFTAAEIVKAFH